MAGNTGRESGDDGVDGVATGSLSFRRGSLLGSAFNSIIISPSPTSNSSEATAAVRYSIKYAVCQIFLLQRGNYCSKIGKSGCNCSPLICHRKANSVDLVNWLLPTHPVALMEAGGKI